MKEMNHICMNVIKYSDETPFVIINIFISNCNLITHFFSVTVRAVQLIEFDYHAHLVSKSGFLISSKCPSHAFRLLHRAVVHRQDTQ